MPFRRHLAEAQARLAYLLLGIFLALGAALLFSPEAIYLLTAPLVQGSPLDPPRHLIFTHLTEALTTHLLVAFSLALWTTLPLGLGELWFFLRPGLYPEEGRRLGVVLGGFPLSLALGTLFTYHFLLPLAWPFLLGFESRDPLALVPLHLEPKIGEYLHFSLHLFLGVSLLFQLPLLLWLLVDLGLLGVEGMVAFRRPFLWGAFLLGALLSPPDLGSQFLLALPLVGMYEILLFGLLVHQGYSPLAEEGGVSKSP